MYPRFDVTKPNNYSAPNATQCSPLNSLGGRAGERLRNTTKNFLSLFAGRNVRGGAPKVSRLIADRRLGIVFQPIVNLHDGAICGYEALVRAPNALRLGSTDALFDSVRAQQHHKQLKLACIEAAIEQWAKKTNGCPLPS